MSYLISHGIMKKSDQIYTDQFQEWIDEAVKELNSSIHSTKISFNQRWNVAVTVV